MAQLEAASGLSRQDEDLADGAEHDRGGVAGDFQSQADVHPFAGEVELVGSAADLDAP